MSEHRRVLGRQERHRFAFPHACAYLFISLWCRSHGDDHADGRHMHARLPLLRGQDESHAAAARPGRAEESVRSHPQVRSRVLAA